MRPNAEKVSHMVLEWHESEKMMTEFPFFLVDYPFKTELDGINEMEWD